jgi:hypothetical protein
VVAGQQRLQKDGTPLRVVELGKPPASAASAASNSVTPAVPTAFTSIATVTAAGGEASLTFSSIPGTYTDLQVRGLAKETAVNTNAYGGLVRFNSDTTSANYFSHQLYGNGASSALAQGNSGSADVVLIGSSLGNISTTNMFGASIIDVADYTSTSKYKTVKAMSGTTINTTTGFYINLTSGVWMSTSAVTSITMVSDSGGYAAGTTFALYGIKAAI